MPAFNEGGNIYGNIAETREVLARAGNEFEIIAVDDGSSDETLAEIERAAADFSDVLATRNPYNMGKGMALRTGFDYSSGDIVVFLDADLDLHPSQIQSLIGVLEAGPWDIVIGSKHHPDSKLDYPAFRKLASWCYYKMIGTMFGLPVRDTQTGLKVFRRKVLETVFHRLMVKKYAYDVELLAAAVRLGYSVHEIPVVLQFRRELKWGRIRFNDISAIVVDTLAIFYRLRILRYYDAERPPMPAVQKKVLVLISGCPPPEDVLKRLSVDACTSVACIDDSGACEREGVNYFASMADFDHWRKQECSDYDYIGFLGRQHLPTGSWVKNAVRNFENPEVAAVCGPVIPGPLKGTGEKTAAYVSASRLSAGPRYYLHSIRTRRAVSRGLAGNVFIRACGWPQDALDFPFAERGIVRNGDGGVLLYDPDVAVSKPVRPFILPYLKSAARDAFLYGRGDRSGGYWQCVFTFLALILCAGPLFLPETFIALSALLYVALVIFTGVSTFDAGIVLWVVAGAFLDNAVRAVAWPAGLSARIFRGSRK